MNKNQRITVRLFINNMFVDSAFFTQVYGDLLERAIKKPSFKSAINAAFKKGDYVKIETAVEEIPVVSSLKIAA